MATKPAKSAKPSKAAKATAPAKAEANDNSKIAKTQLIELIADKNSLSKKDAGEAVTVLLEAIVDALRGGGSVGLPGLGTLSVTETKERQGVRPGTTDKITIPAGKKIRFKVATTLKEAL